MSGRDAIDADYVVIDENEARARFDENRARVEAGFWPKIRKVARRIPFLEDVVAAYYCAMDTNTPLLVRVTFMAALAYLVVPTDVVPDFIVGLGLVDDIAVLGVISRFLQAIRPEHRAAAHRALES